MKDQKLFIFGGLPGSGKSELAKRLAQQIKAVYLRVDTLEGRLEAEDLYVGPLGYLLAYDVARENLKLGNSVIADSVNSIEVTRDAWRRVATDLGIEAIEIEITCSDAAEHRKRIEERAKTSGTPGHRVLTWQKVKDREYAPWGSANISIDTAGSTINQCFEQLSDKIRKLVDLMSQ